MNSTIPIIFAPHQGEDLKTAALDTPPLDATSMRTNSNGRPLGRTISARMTGVTSWS